MSWVPDAVVPARRHPVMRRRRRHDDSGSDTTQAAPVEALQLLDSAAREQVVGDLQGRAGNGAVATLVQRQGAVLAPPPPGPPAAPPTPADLRPLAALDALTLSDFHSYAEAQADWSTSPTLTAPTRRALWRLLEWARGNPAVMTGCGGMLVSELRGPVAQLDSRNRLLAYSQGVEGEGDVLRVPSISDVTRALAWGGAMRKLYRVPGPAVVKEGIKQETDAADVLTGQLEELVNGGFVDSFIAYHRQARPFWESHYDTRAYLRQRKEDSSDPVRFVGTLPDVRNYHRFMAELLRNARANLADRTRRRPLSLVLHSSHDHNGAFMRDANLTAVFARGTHLTLLIEGATTLASIEGRLPVLARAYGRGRKISEAMVAGHGDSRSLELAGVPGAGGPDQNLNLDTNAGPTERFFSSLLANMENSPDARIVLNACLTASNEVNRPLDPGDPAQASADIQAAIAADPSLATKVRALAAARGMTAEVRGATGSFSSEATLLDSSGRLDIVSGFDPQLTNPDKFQYVRHGQDPDGAMRSVLECWAIDRARTLTLVEERRDELARSTEVHGAVIRELYSIVLDNPTNAQLINVLANTATPLAHLGWDTESLPGKWSGADTLARRVPAAHMARIFPPVEAAATAEGNAAARLVVGAAWAKADAARRDAFLATLARYGCRDVDRYLPDGLLTGHMSVANLVASSGDDAGKLRVAIVGVRRQWTGHETAKTHLQGRLGTDRTFAPPVGVTGAIDGYWNEPALLAAIDRAPADVAPPPGPGPGPDTGPAPNVDLDGDGVNDFYIVPETRRGGVTARALNVRDRPGMDAGIVASLASGAPVEIIGRSGDWLAIDLRRQVRFVHSRYVRVARTP